MELYGKVSRSEFLCMLCMISRFEDFAGERGVRVCVSS